MCNFEKTSRHRLQTAERNTKDGRLRWVFDFLDISVSASPSEIAETKYRWNFLD